MKTQWKQQYLPCLMLFLGGLGWLIRLAMYLYAMDEKGLLIPGHPTRWALMLTAAVAVGAIFFPPALPHEAKPLAGPAWLPAAGSFALAAGMVSAALKLAIVDALEIITRILGFAAAAGQIWAGVCHLRSRKPSFAGDALSCLFFAMLMVCSYHIWSGNPQIHQYVFFAIALILLAFTAWCRAAYATGLGWGKGHYALALGAAFACLTGIPESGAATLLAAGALWAIFGLYRPEASETQEV